MEGPSTTTEQTLIEQQSFLEWFKNDFPKLFIDAFAKLRDTLVRATQEHLIAPLTRFGMFQSPEAPASQGSPPLPTANHKAEEESPQPPRSSRR